MLDIKLYSSSLEDDMFVQMWEKKSLRERCEKENKKIIVWGATDFSLNLCKELELEKYIWGIVDNNAEMQKQGKAYAPIILKEMDEKEYLILITARNIFSENQIKKEIANKICKDYDVYAFGQLQCSSDDEYWEKTVVGQCLRFEDLYLQQNKILLEDEEKYWKDRYEYFANRENVVVPALIFILSNCCTLRCEKCSMLMPYFTERWEMPLEEAISSIDTLLRGVDEVIRFNLIGGEPLLYQNLDKIIYHLEKSDKVKQIALNTNSTIIPKEHILESLKSPKVHVVLSDYGNVVQMAKLVECFEKQNINFEIWSEQTWVDFGGTESRQRSAELLEAFYMRCGAAKTDKAVLGNKFFSCERAARMHMLGNVYNAENDYVELNHKDTDEELRKKVHEMLVRKTSDACNHCDLASADIFKVVEPGIQMGKGSFVRSKYTLVKRREDDSSC